MFDSLTFLRRLLGVSATESRRRRAARRQRPAPLVLEQLETRLAPAISIFPTSSTLRSDTINVGYDQTIRASGGTGHFTFSVSNDQNSLDGLNVPNVSTGSLTIKGTPTASGTETFTVTARDSAGDTASRDYSITVNPAIALSPTPLPADTIHVPYSQAFTASGAVNTFYANKVVSYTPGTLADSSYDNPLAALGGLDPVTGSFGGHGSPISTDYLTPFDPAFSSSDLVEIGAGGSLVVKLAQTASTNGDTIGVHTGFGLADGDYPNGTNTNPATYFNSWLRQADVQVSADGMHWGDLGTITFSSPSNIDTGAATDPEGASPGVGPAANPGQPFLGSLSSFNGLNWQQTLGVLNGSAGGTWLNLSGVKNANGKPITGVNYIKFSVPSDPPLDPNTGNPELMMVDAVVGFNGGSSISASGGTGNIRLIVSNVRNPIAGLTIPRSSINSLTIGGAPKVTGTETFTVTAIDAAGGRTTTNYSITVNPAVPPTLAIGGAGSVNEEATYTLNLSGSDTSPQTLSSWTINWGDGHVQKVTGNPTSVTHVYADGPRSYTISAAATDQTGTYKAGNQVVVEVDHAAPTLSISGASSVNKGDVYTLNLSGTDTHKIVHWTINWGDGSAPEIVSGNPKLVKHVYTEVRSDFIISATAADNEGVYNASDTVTVNVNG